LKLAASPSDFALQDSEGGESGPLQMNITYKFPWGVDTVETIINKEEMPLSALQSNTGINHQVTAEH